MDIKPLEGLGKVAGIGGIALGAMVYVLKDLLASSVLQNLPADQAALLLQAVVIGLFVIAALGIIAWVLARRISAVGGVTTSDSTRTTVNINLPASAVQKGVGPVKTRRSEDTKVGIDATHGDSGEDQR